MYGIRLLLCRYREWHAYPELGAGLLRQQEPLHRSNSLIRYVQVLKRSPLQPLSAQEPCLLGRIPCMLDSSAIAAC